MSVHELYFLNSHDIKSIFSSLRIYKKEPKLREEIRLGVYIEVSLCYWSKNHWCIVSSNFLLLGISVIKA
jgi:hypothetical protein